MLNYQRVLANKIEQQSINLLMISILDLPFLSVDLTFLLLFGRDLTVLSFLGLGLLNVFNVDPIFVDHIFPNQLEIGP